MFGTTTYVLGCEFVTETYRIPINGNPIENAVITKKPLSTVPKNFSKEVLQYWDKWPIVGEA
jgi:hypothetical protein